MISSIRGDTVIQIKLHELMGKNKYKIQDVHELTGLSRTTVSELYHGRAAMINFKTIDKLCTLFNCTPNDLIEFTNEESENEKQE